MKNSADNATPAGVSLNGLSGLVLMKLREMATKGDIKAAQLLLDRGYGKAKQNIDITTQGEKVTIPTIIFTKDEDKG